MEAKEGGDICFFILAVLHLFYNLGHLLCERGNKKNLSFQTQGVLFVTIWSNPCCKSLILVAHCYCEGPPYILCTFQHKRPTGHHIPCQSILHSIRNQCIDYLTYQPFRFSKNVPSLTFVGSPPYMQRQETGSTGPQVTVIQQSLVQHQLHTDLCVRRWKGCKEREKLALVSRNSNPGGEKDV